MGSIAKSPLAVMDRYFDLEVHPPGADDSALEEHFSLRYSVFCEECGFMPTENYPDNLESDKFDPDAAHFGARNADRLMVGTSRLALPVRGNPFPYESHCTSFDEFVTPAHNESAEVSRLAIHPLYRRRSGDTYSGVNPANFDGLGKPDPQKQKKQGIEKRVNAPLLALALYREMYRFSRANGIRYWYAAMEKPLARVLGLYGFAFKPIGPEQDYYGPVTPYLGDLRDLEAHLGGYNEELLKWFQTG